MDEENRRFSWTNLFIKVIIVVIFILFTVWLLSLSNKGLSNKLDVLTDNIYAENIDRMKEVGKEYFTTERLPEKVGDIKTLTLAKMYDENLILEIKDKYGHACSAKNSYVSIEKMENEYQMKVYLECGEESEYIIVIMGCYDYCDSDICEKKNDSDKAIEYEYKKTTGGSWTEYGKWSEWSKVSVTKTNYRDVETKVVKEAYSYDKTIVENDYKSLNLSCPSGYTKTSDGTKCYKVVSTTDYKGFNNSCPSGYKVTTDGTRCYKVVNLTANPSSCPEEYNGYTLVSQNGFTCNYSKTVSTPYQATENYTGTCYSNQTTTVIPCTGCAPQHQTVSVPYSCTKTHTVTKYKTTTENKSFTDLVSCPTGYTPSGSNCVKTNTEYKHFVKSCPTGYEATSDNTKCYKTTSKTEYKDFVKSCPTDYKITSDNTKCYKEVSSVVKVTGTKDVTYYRYRVREYVGGTVDYKWSTSKNDKKLLDAGYTLTGKTR